MDNPVKYKPSSQQPRIILSNMPHELCFRVRSGLPFPTWRLMKLLLTSAMASSVRNYNVKICHFLWMANHLHLIVIPQDASQLIKFYGEFKKRITDYLKILLGESSMSLWEENSMIAPILDYEGMIKRIAYLFSNPAKADLIDTISKYDHLSSYDYLVKANDEDFSENIIVPWIRLPTLTKLPSLRLSNKQDEQIVNSLTAQTKKTVHLSITPFAWLKCYSDVNKKNSLDAKGDILRMVKEYENNAFQTRISNNKKTTGMGKLFTQGIILIYKSTKKSIRPFVFAGEPELRSMAITIMKAMAKKARELYFKACSGEKVVWLPGMFPPPLIPRANLISIA